MTRGPLRLLFSYAYYDGYDMADVRTQLMEDGVKPSVMADSGGYSAESQGQTISLSSYARWLNAYRDEIDFAVNLDVIGDAEGTWRNHHDLEDLLGRPITPTIHYGTSVERAQMYFDEGHRLMCLGGIASGRKTSRERRYRWLHAFFVWAKEVGVVYHGLGVGAFSHIYAWPWFSVDSANPTRLANRFARAYVFDPQNARHIVTLAADRSSYDPRVTYLLRQIGVDPGVLATERYNALWAEAITADSYRRIESWVRARREPVCWTTGNLEGLRVYVAGGVGAIPLSMIGEVNEAKRWVPAS